MHHPRELLIGDVRGLTECAQSRLISRHTKIKLVISDGALARKGRHPVRNSPRLTSPLVATLTLTKARKMASFSRFVGLEPGLKVQFLKGFLRLLLRHELNFSGYFLPTLAML